MEGQHFAERGGNISFSVNRPYDDALLLTHFVEGVAHEASAVLDLLGIPLRLLRTVEVAECGVVVRRKDFIRNLVVAANRERSFRFR